jgi:hypothetical protein
LSCPFSLFFGQIRPFPSEPVLSIDEFIWVPKEQANLVKSAGRAIRFFPLSALIIHP